MYAVFLLLGTTALLPWNGFITEKEFFDVRLHATPALQPLADNFVAAFALVFNAANLAALAVLNCWPAAAGSGSGGGSAAALLPTLAGVFAVLAGTAGLALATQVSTAHSCVDV